MGIVDIQRKHEYDYLKFKLTYDSDAIKENKYRNLLMQYGPNILYLRFYDFQNFYRFFEYLLFSL